MHIKDVRLIVKQPDGLFALFDFTNQHFILRDMTSVEEIGDYLVDRQTNTIASDILNFFHQRADGIAGNHDPFFDTAMELMDKNG